MKIALLGPSHVPFIWGGLENLIVGLETHLRQKHTVEVFKIPTREHSVLELIESYNQWANLELSSFDAVISMKYPTWMVQHPRHIVWMMHCLRGLYDTYPSELARELPTLSAPVRGAFVAFSEAVEFGASNREAAALAAAVALAADEHQPELMSFPGPLARVLVHGLDALAMRPSRIITYAAASHEVASREYYFPHGEKVEIVYPPVARDDFTKGEAGDYFFTASRLDGPKRLDLIVEAFRQHKSPLSLIIAGTGPEMSRLQNLAAEDARIQLVGFVSDTQLRDYYAHARAVVFTPYHEDFGYVALEAQRSAKAVITCTDSGGAAELVAHGKSGLVVASDVQELSAAFSRLAADPVYASTLGVNGFESSQNISWAKTGHALLARAQTSATASRTKRRRKMTVGVPFSISPVSGGGKVRVYELYRRLAKHFNIDLVCIDVWGRASVRELAPNLREIVVGASDAHRMMDAQLATLAGGVPVTDIALIPLLELSPEYMTAFAASARDADVLVACHPYVLPALMPFAGLKPIVYEAQDFELKLKERALANSVDARELLDATRMSEEWCLRNAVFTMTCSNDETESLREFYNLREQNMAVVPNCVDIEATTYLGPSGRQKLGINSRSMCVFVGSWHPPNLDAADEIITRLAPALPEVQFVIVGNLAGYFQGRTMPANVLLTGFVTAQEKLELLHSADLAINPIAYGTGTNLKMLEYFAAGTPVITTAVGIRGQEAFLDAARVVERHEFASAIRHALAHPEAALARTGLARAIVEREFSWESAAEYAADLFEKWI